jgi:hypothetical protein
VQKGITEYGVGGADQEKPEAVFYFQEAGVRSARWRLRSEAICEIMAAG